MIDADASAGTGASGTAWMTDPNRACRDEPVETFITPGDADDEPPYPSPRARKLCQVCEVRTNCLAWALAEDIEFGVFGGMSAYQRRQLTSKRERKRCIACPSHDIIVENGNEICLACGTSWLIL